MCGALQLTPRSLKCSGSASCSVKHAHIDTAMQETSEVICSQCLANDLGTAYYDTGDEGGIDSELSDVDANPCDVRLKLNKIFISCRGSSDQSRLNYPEDHRVKKARVDGETLYCVDTEQVFYY